MYAAEFIFKVISFPSQNLIGVRGDYCCLLILLHLQRVVEAGRISRRVQFERAFFAMIRLFRVRFVPSYGHDRVCYEGVRSQKHAVP